MVNFQQVPFVIFSCHVMYVISCPNVISCDMNIVISIYIGDDHDARIPTEIRPPDKKHGIAQVSLGLHHTVCLTMVRYYSMSVLIIVIHVISCHVCHAYIWMLM